MGDIEFWIDVSVGNYPEEIHLNIPVDSSHFYMYFEICMKQYAGWYIVTDDDGYIRRYYFIDNGEPIHRADIINCKDYDDPYDYYAN